MVPPPDDKLEPEAAEIPQLSQSGSAGVQSSSSSSAIVAQTKSPLSGLPIVNTVQGLVSTHPRSMGGEFAAKLLAGSFHQISHDLADTRSELREARDELAKLTNRLSTKEVEVGVLRERVSSFSREATLKKVCITVGTGLFGFSVEVYRNNLNKLALILLLAASVLLVSGWLPPKKGGTP